MTMAKAVETRAMIERSGIACPLVTGGSTGTYRFDAENPGITELQPGSFVFMDYGMAPLAGPMEPSTSDFKNAPTVVTTVVSRPPGMAIVDGGYKAFATDRPFTPKAVGIEGVIWVGRRRARASRRVECIARSARRPRRIHPAACRSNGQSLRLHLCVARRYGRSNLADRRARQVAIR
jgi:D-serine deaminase-like pyridoxal phosphate-dependent protein